MDKNIYQAMTSVQSCLHSFCPSTNISELHLSNFPSKLAEAGFERTPESRSSTAIHDEVQCKTCGIRYSGWSGERPLAVHRTLSPNCFFLNTPPASRQMSNTQKENQRNALKNIRKHLFSDYDSLASKIEDYPDIQHPFVPRRGDFFMLFESFRLLTFQDPRSAEAAVFAKCGFIFDANSFSAACVFCNEELKFQNIELVKVEFLHAEKSPNCPLVRDYDVGNISREEERLIHEKVQNTSHEKALSNCSRSVVSQFLVKQPEYEDKKTRVGTFDSWPALLAVEFSEVSMAECGFYYTGFRDSVKCFCCGVGLCRWTRGADPCSQHAKASPQCFYILKLKGQEFVEIAKRVQLTVQVECRETKSTDSDSSQESVCDPSMTNTSPSSSSPSLVGSPHLDLEAIKAATCQYTMQKIANAVRNFFVLSNGRYPNTQLLEGALKAADQNYTQVCQQRQEIIIKDGVIQAKDKEIVQTKTDFKRKETVFERKLRATQTELERAKDTLEWRNTEMRTELEQQFIGQIQQQREVIQRKDQMLQQNKEIMDRKDQMLVEKDEIIEQKILMIELKNRQVEDQQRHIQSLMASLEQAEVAAGATAPIVVPSETVKEGEFPVASYKVCPQTNPAESDDAEKEEEFPVANCKVCLSRTAQIVFRPCKHLCCCDACAARLYGKSCPICRETNLAMEKVYVI